MRAVTMIAIAALALATGASVNAAEVKGNAVVRLPMQPHSKMERKAIMHLHHAYDLLRKANEELRVARHFHEWPDLDWNSLITGSDRYAKMLAKFLYPAYRVPPYPEGADDPSASAATTARPEVYPNGEDLISKPSE